MMRAIFANSSWGDIEGATELDRAPGTPLLGFISGSVVSLGLWALLSWVAFSLFV